VLRRAAASKAKGRGANRNPARSPRPAPGFDLVATPFGVCGLVAGARGLLRVVLPLGPAARMERFLRRAHPGARRDRRRCRRTADALRVFFRTGRMSRSGPVDFGAASPLERAVYEAMRRTRAGDLLTYGALARRIGRPRAARAVGRALGRNPCPLIVPCHRVVRSDGSPGGFSCPGGVALKRRLIEFESAFRLARPGR
jgi:methylated-DNA-[protein]-cysteine S-methyltransferase